MPVKGKKYSSKEIFTTIHDSILAIYPNFRPCYALFGCSDEVNSQCDMDRNSVFGAENGVFTTRMIGSQVFYQ